MDRKKILKSLGIIVGITLFVTLSTRLAQKSNYTLADYAADHPERNVKTEKSISAGDDSTYGEISKNNEAEKKQDVNSGKEKTASGNEEADLIETDMENEVKQEISTEMLIGETLMHLDGSEGDFFRKDISDDLRKYITGISYPAEKQKDIEISDLDYVHIKYMDFEGNSANGELICNKYISEDLIYIFSKLYENDYRIEKVRLIDEYDGDDDLSMADNNSSCFNYRNIVGTKNLSKHSLGLAIDINPLYNPYITYNDDGTDNVFPEDSKEYVDRSKSFPYKIDENDLCYKLFTERGFTWGGNWNSTKDYQHFQKTKP